jgi:uncharacterized protein (DUF736 family)
MKNNNKPIGALWITKSKSGTEYLKGNLDLGPLFPKVDIVVFKNDKKTGSQPDYRILVSQPQSKEEPF